MKSIQLIKNSFIHLNNVFRVSKQWPEELKYSGTIEKKLIKKLLNYQIKYIHCPYFN